MNRRTVLGFAGASVTVGLAGCVEGVKEHFGLTGIIPVEIHSEAEETHNLHLEARELETGRQSYQESIAVPPGDTVGPPHLSQTEQSVQIYRIEDNEEVGSEAVTVSPDVELLSIVVYDDDLEVSLEWSEDAAGEFDGNSTADSDANDSDASGANDADGSNDTDDSDANDSTGSDADDTDASESNPNETDQ